jgi:hypothetical protein
MNVARFEFVSLLHLDLEPRLTALWHAAEARGIAVSLSGVAGSANPGVRFGVEGVGEVGYFWKAGEVYRQWRPAPDAPWDERVSTMEEVAGLVAEAEAMVARAGRP